ncbi:MAG TPA: hypothetical protein VN181_10205, partial [Thermoanaerobaculia bacterium]|nr:hypothetical protein [Thermoanaerobaculia bacterium]
KGFFFFETSNNLNPQNGGPGTVVAGTADPCGAQGFIYINYSMFKTTGCGGANGLFPQPGEPFRDIGYRRVNKVNPNGGDFATDAAGKFVTEGAYDGLFTYEDLPFSNGAAAANNTFDVCVAQKTVTRESDGKAQTFWLPLPYYPGCTPGNNITTPGCNCSEPHEPYFNLNYNGNRLNLTMEWLDPSTVGRPKKTTDETPYGTAVTCNANMLATAAGQDTCTTNAYDYLGGLATIDAGLIGVVYNEGDYESTGQCEYVGSVVVGGDTRPRGTTNVWFDERLIKGGWPPKGIPFPRVMITSLQVQ